MDPQANIAEQTGIAEAIAEGGYIVSQRDDAERLAELVLALDEWRRHGGYDPYTPNGGRVPLTEWRMATNEVRIQMAIEYLRAARDLFNAAGAVKTTARVRAALSSAYGARRHAESESYRTKRQHTNRREKCAVCGEPATRGNEFAALCDEHDSSEIENGPRRPCDDDRGCGDVNCAACYGPAVHNWPGLDLGVIGA